MLPLVVSLALADPCGMVPPLNVGGPGPSLERSGVQRTYVMHHDGVLKELQVSVIDGVFPQALLASQNLVFEPYLAKGRPPRKDPLTPADLYFAFMKKG